MKWSSLKFLGQLDFYLRIVRANDDNELGTMFSPHECGLFREGLLIREDILKIMGGSPSKEELVYLCCPATSTDFISSHLPTKDDNCSS